MERLYEGIYSFGDIDVGLNATELYIGLPRILDAGPRSAASFCNSLRKRSGWDDRDDCIPCL